MNNLTNQTVVPSVSITTAHTGASGKANQLGMRPMQEQRRTRRKTAMKRHGHYPWIALQ